MKKAFTATTQDMAILLDEQLSTNQGMTPEGYLVCQNVPVSRTGVQYYYGYELDPDGKAGLSANKRYPVYRLPEDVFEPESLQSLESKPLTDEHPSKGVTVHNAGWLTMGHGRNARHNDKNVIADLIVTNPNLIDGIRAKRKYEISLGYTCKYSPYKDGFKQTNIRINHIAVVESGRAGSQVSIKDKMPISVNNRRNRKMDKKTAIATMFAAFAKDASPDEITEMMPFVLDADAAKPAVETKDSGDNKGLMAALVGLLSKDAKPAAAKPAASVEPELTADSIAKLIQDEVAKALKKQAKDAKPAAGKDAAAKLLDALLKDADPEEEETETGDEDPDEEETETGDEDPEEEGKEKEANDAAFANVVKAIQPVYSKMPKKEQRVIKDQLAKLQKNPSAKGYAGILKAIKSHTKDAAASAQPVPAQDAISRKVMAERNPHYAKKA